MALNLAGVCVGAVAWGDAVVGAGASIAATTVLDARLSLRAAASWPAYPVPHGTRDVAGRFADLGDGDW